MNRNKLLRAGIFAFCILSTAALDYGHGKIFDITHKITSQLPTFDSMSGLGHFIWLVSSIKNGSTANVSEFKLGTHTGTHVDAPSHFFQEYYEQGFDVTSLSLQALNGKAAFDFSSLLHFFLLLFSSNFGGVSSVENVDHVGFIVCVGPALVVDVPRDQNITAEVMKSLKIPRGVHRVLFKTLNTDRMLMHKTEFTSDFTGFKKDGAQWLVDNTDIKLVGLDYLSVSAYDDASPTHHIFLRNREIHLVEGLNLDGIEPGKYTVNCLPLRMVGADGCPTRCILTA
ncbi:hypothetical protein V6N13_029958 [Hibiscus sabdariffa]|uniref:Uncharacterized protein n=1 Tax=Hibiscus sabdariffa TaxID=183260 RepID=A0ABR2T9A0_9ROSI